MSTSNSKHGSFLCEKMIKLPTPKGEHSCKYTELPFKRKVGITKEQYNGGRTPCVEMYCQMGITPR